ncbi:MAG: GNAT family N-acetyltransferase, partial [Sciscionella sp.]
SGTPAVRAEPVSAPECALLLREYMTEMAARYWNRQVSPAEVDRALAEMPGEDLAPPSGLFLVLRIGERAAGCTGLKVIDAGTVELKRMYVRSEYRGVGNGGRLLRAAEAHAKGMHAHVLRLDTRDDLVEARALYAAHGFTEVTPFGESRYSDHWYAKTL